MIQGERTDNPYPNNQKIEGIVNRLNEWKYWRKFYILLNYISNASKFFAEKIHGFKVKDLIHFIWSNGDILNKIKDAYKKLYNNKLIDDIKNNTDGDFRIGLSILIGK